MAEVLEKNALDEEPMRTFTTLSQLYLGYQRHRMSVHKLATPVAKDLFPHIAKADFTPVYGMMLFKRFDPTDNSIAWIPMPCTESAFKENQFACPIVSTNKFVELVTGNCKTNLVMAENFGIVCSSDFDVERAQDAVALGRLNSLEPSKLTDFFKSIKRSSSEKGKSTLRKRQVDPRLEQTDDGSRNKRRCAQILSDSD